MTSGDRRIVIDGYDAIIRSPFEAKDLIKSMPVRRWDSSIKCWVIPAEDADELQAVLEAEDFKVIVTRKTGQQDHRRRDDTSRDDRTAAGSWADQMYAALGPELGERAFKALLKVVHPDAEGSTTIMQQLNVARDRHRQRT